MSEILRDLSESALVRAIEENYYALTPFYYNWPNMEVYSGDDVCWCMTDIAFASINAIFRAKLRPDDVDKTIEAVIAKGNEKRVPLNWLLGRDTTPSNLRERLLAYGFIDEGDGAGMAIDLHAMNEKAPVPSDFSIVEVTNGDVLQTWCHVTAVGFGMPEHDEPALLEWLKGVFDLNLPVKLYLAYLGNKPVATSMYFLAEGVAGIYFVNTIPEARKQGIGFAVTLKPLQDARDLGYRVGILHASNMGEPVYRRMGFKRYSTVGSYLWLDDYHKKLAAENK